MSLILQMLQNDIFSNTELASQLHQPITLCNHVLYHLTHLDFINITETMGNPISIQVWNVSAELNRAFKNGAIEDFTKKRGI